jgi:hypothetical protein
VATTDVRVLGHDAFDHATEVRTGDVAEVGIEALDRESERGREILLVAGDDVDERDELAVDALRRRLPTDALPE